MDDQFGFGMAEFDSPSNFKFSGADVDELTSSEYTIVTVLVDETLSVSGFSSELEECIKSIASSCAKHPRSEQILMRVATFSSAGGDDVRELHGYVPISNIDESVYVISPHGMTPLYDATLNSIETTIEYSKELFENDFSCNAVVFVITDGDNNSSKTATPEKIKECVADAKTAESVAGITTILLGVNTAASGIDGYLQSFKVDAGFDQYEAIENADASSLAKLAQFISKSISSTSTSLANGAPSQPIDFAL